MPALLSTLGVFALVLALGRFRVPLGLALLVGAVLLGFLGGLGPIEVGAACLRGAVSPSALGLALVTALQVLLATSMESAGQIRALVDAARQALGRPAAAMATLPALIGLLPMPGGALFSAPMVQAATEGHAVRPARLSAVNYWFRHVWEHWWPLYPGVILAMGLTGTGYLRFAAYQAPLGLAMITAGLVLLVPLPVALRRASSDRVRGSWKRLLAATLPIWLIVIVAALTAVCLPLLPSGLSEAAATAIGRYGPIGLGLVAGVSWTFRTGGLGLRDLSAFLRRRPIWDLPLLVVSVMVFQALLATVGAPERIAAELGRAHVPLLAVIVVLPFVAGAVTGLAVGFVGTSFPIVLPLACGLWGDRCFPLLAMAYAAGHLGQMASPIHLCQVLSNRYFETSWGAVFRLLAPVLLLTALLQGAWVALLSFLTR
ncbi:MAG: DUF401 family protein [Deltaproteobacteria bacterium]|nr:DUF401 family protein [Deltaproteobacteria bacterium]